MKKLISILFIFFMLFGVMPNIKVHANHTEVSEEMLEEYLEAGLFIYDIPGGQVAADDQVFQYIFMVLGRFQDKFDSYLGEDQMFRIPYDVFMSYVEDSFYKHSDMKKYFKRKGMIDEENQMILYSFGGWGTATSFELKGIDYSNDIFELYMEEYEGDENKPRAYYKLSLICTCEGLKIYGIEEVKEIVIENPFSFDNHSIHYDNGDSYYKINHNESNYTISYENAITIDGYEGYWIKENEDLKVTIQMDEGYAFNRFLVNGKLVEMDESSYIIKNVNEALHIEVDLVNYIPISSIQLNANNLTLKQNETYQFNALIQPNNTHDNQTIIWSSQDDKIATVDQNGWIQPKSSGTVLITATTSNGLTDSCLVTIEEVKNGWIKENNTWYYYQENLMTKGWKNIDNIWYYFLEDGSMVNENKIIDGKENLFASNGKWLGYKQGWIKDNNEWNYYINGTKATQWQKVNNTWYYMDTSGVMQTGWLKLGDTWYYMNSSGAMVTGTQTINGKVYTFNNSGVWIG